TRLLDVLGPPIHRICLAIATDLTKFGRQHHLVPFSLERPADDFFIVAPAIHVRGIEMVDAKVYRVADQCLRLSILGCTVDALQRHAAEANRGDRQATLAKLTIRDLRHNSSPSRTIYALKTRLAGSDVQRSLAVSCWLKFRPRSG